jgi:hypothetical protein
MTVALLPFRLIITGPLHLAMIPKEKHPPLETLAPPKAVDLQLPKVQMDRAQYFGTWVLGKEHEPKRWYSDGSRFVSERLTYCCWWRIYNGSAVGDINRSASINAGGTFRCTYRNKYFPGDGFSTTKAASPADCTKTCEQSLSCIAYTYFKQTQSCRLFKTAEKYGESAAAESGVKSQSK